MHIPILLLPVSNNKWEDWFGALVPLPNNIWLCIKLVVLIHPRETNNVPDILDAFKVIKREPFTDNVSVVRLEAFKEVKPEPFTDNVPVVIL